MFCLIMLGTHIIYNPLIIHTHIIYFFAHQVTVRNKRQNYLIQLIFSNFQESGSFFSIKGTQNEAKSEAKSEAPFPVPIDLPPVPYVKGKG